MLYKRVKSDVCSRIDYFFAQGQFVLTWVPFESRSKIESSFVRVITVSSKIIYFRIIRLNRGTRCLVLFTLRWRWNDRKSWVELEKLRLTPLSQIGPSALWMRYCILFNTLFRWSARSNLVIVCHAQPDARHSSIKWCLIVGNKCQMSALRLIWSSNHWIDSLGNIFIFYFSLLLET